MHTHQRTIWQVPQLRHEGELGVHRRVTWLELFFDLVFVVAVAQAAHAAVAHPSLAGMGAYIATFLPIFWTWNAATYYTERFETEGVETRLFTFLQMLVVAGLAVNAHHATTDSFVGFAGAYAVGRVLMIILWTRAGRHVPAFRPVSMRFAMGFSVSVALVVAGALLGGGATGMVLFGMALFVDIATPLTTMRLQRALPRMSASKLPERFGLFIIIVLGEAVAGVIHGLAERTEWTPMLGVAGVAGLAVAFALWWLYFDFAGRRVPVATPTATLVWTYLHMLLAMSLAVCGAALLPTLQAEEVVQAPIRVIFTGAAGLSLVVIGLLDHALSRDAGEPTHRYAWSLLVGIGLAIAGLGWAPLAAIPLLSLVVVFSAIPMVYGLWVWFFPSRGLAETTLHPSTHDAGVRDA